MLELVPVCRTDQAVGMNESAQSRMPNRKIMNIECPSLPGRKRAWPPGMNVNFLSQLTTAQSAVRKNLSTINVPTVA